MVVVCVLKSDLNKKDVHYKNSFASTITGVLCSPKFISIESMNHDSLLNWL